MAGHTADVSVRFPPVSAALPGAPQNFTATAGDGEVTLSWSAPTSNGGAAITKYQYAQKTGNNAYSDSDYVDIPGSNGATTSYTVTSLTNDVEYRFKICALNSAGCGAKTAEQTATPRASIVAPSDTTSPHRNLRSLQTVTITKQATTSPLSLMKQSER